MSTHLEHNVVAEGMLDALHVVLSLRLGDLNRLRRLEQRAEVGQFGNSSQLLCEVNGGYLVTPAIFVSQSRYCVEFCFPPRPNLTA